MNPATNTQANIMPMYPGIDQPSDADDGPNLPKAPLNTLLGFDLETYQIPLDAAHAQQAHARRRDEHPKVQANRLVHP